MSDIYVSLAFWSGYLGKSSSLEIQICVQEIVARVPRLAGKWKVSPRPRSSPITSAKKHLRLFLTEGSR